MKLTKTSGTYCELTAAKTVTRDGSEVKGNTIEKGDVIDVADEVGSVLLHDEPHNWALVATGKAAKAKTE